MDAQREPDALARLDAGNRLFALPLGRVLRTAGDVSAGHVVGNASHSGGVLEWLEAPDDGFRGNLLYRCGRAVVRAPVLARLVRFPQPRGPLRELLHQFAARHAGAPALLHGTGAAVPVVRAEYVGHYGVRFAAGI